MKRIDAHLHFIKGEYGFDQLAEAAGHQNSEEHLMAVYDELGIEQGVVMSNRTLELDRHIYPERLSYCAGLDSTYLREHGLAESVALVEQHLLRKQCVGIKLYPGYNHSYITDELYEPYYALAEKYNKPVAVHTGATSIDYAILKYSHPLIIDEVAAKHPNVHFVMCHFGNPWVVDAAAVLEKNKNVSTDLSGVLVGKPDLGRLFKEQKGYIEHMRTWLMYADAFDRVMFGTDWPLANIEAYISFVEHIVPERHHEKVFYDNAKRIYNL